MFWFNKENPDVTFMDNRELDTTFDGNRKLLIKLDVMADFTNMPFPDNTFYLVVFDPPHLKYAGKSSWLRKKYGVLPKEWHETINKGFNECMRVLKVNGTLVFKWSEDQITTAEVLKCIDYKPLFGHRRGKTIFLVFFKREM